MGGLGAGPGASELSVKFDARRNDLRSIIGVMGGHYIANSTGDDVPIPAAYRNCRFAECDVSGLIKVDYLSDSGDTYTIVCNCVEGGIIRVARIQRVYRYYTGTTACTAQVYTSTGSLVTGIRLCL
jgi:hypothetical protein